MPVSIVAVVQEFATFARNLDPSVACDLPYGIEGDKIGGLTIKLLFNKDVKWTKALKYMLTDLKWCLKWMIKVQQGVSSPEQDACPA
jgi:beclin